MIWTIKKDFKKECELCRIWWIKMHATVTVWTKWQIVIPKELRKELNINPWDNLFTFSKHGKAIALVKTEDMEDFSNFIQQEIEIIKKTNF